MPEQEIDFYQLGYDSYNEYIDNEWSWNLMPEGYKWDYHKNSEFPHELSNLYDLANEGMKQARKDFLLPYVGNAMNAYRRFAEEYSVRVSTGCGCCGAGWSITVEGVTYEFDPGDFE